MRENRNGAEVRTGAGSRAPGLISVVIPMRNEAESVRLLVAELLEIEPLLAPRRLEVVLVDDGSTDATWEISADLSARHPQVKAVKLRRNFGKGPALSAGFGAAGGEFMVMMDGDLQDNPKHLPEMARLLEAGYDVVCGWKRRRCDPWHKIWPSRALNFAVRGIFGASIHDLNCGLKGFRGSVIKWLPFYGELYRYVVVVAKEKGFKVAEIEVEHRPRRHGRSNYGWSRFVKGLLDLLTVRFLSAYEARPLHFLGTIGLGLMLAGGAGLSYLAALWLLGLGPIGSRPLLSYSGLAIIFGTQMITLGVLAELIVAKSGGANGGFPAGYEIEVMAGAVSRAACEPDGVADASLPLEPRSILERAPDGLDSKLRNQGQAHS
jgi:glycosyltransferase involved in cell wall biosynthesis